MRASACRVTIINCAGVSVIAVNWRVGASAIGIAAISRTGVVVVAGDRGVAATAVVTYIRSARISVITVYSSARVATIGNFGEQASERGITFIYCAGIAVIANHICILTSADGVTAVNRADIIIAAIYIQMEALVVEANVVRANAAVITIIIAVAASGNGRKRAARSGIASVRCANIVVVAINRVMNAVVVDAYIVGAGIIIVATGVVRAAI